MKTIKEKWESYLKDVMPESAGAIQLLETRRAFYAGAHALFTLMSENVSQGDDVTAQDEAFMETIPRELAEFVADINRGKA